MGDSEDVHGTGEAHCKFAVVWADLKSLANLPRLLNSTGTSIQQRSCRPNSTLSTCASVGAALAAKAVWRYPCRSAYHHESIF